MSSWPWVEKWHGMGDHNGMQQGQWHASGHSVNLDLVALVRCEVD